MSHDPSHDPSHDSDWKAPPAAKTSKKKTAKAATQPQNASNQVIANLAAQSGPAAAALVANAPVGNAAVAAVVARPAKLPIKYEGGDHADRHFKGLKPKPNLAKWAIDTKDATKNKAAATALMEASITTHMATLMAQSSLTGISLWYISDVVRGTIGKTTKGDESMFTMQVTVNIPEGEITYHGYPDQTVVKYGLGKSKNTIGKA
jgi:hypothetical protein